MQGYWKFYFYEDHIQNSQEKRNHKVRRNANSYDRKKCDYYEKSKRNKRKRDRSVKRNLDSFYYPIINNNMQQSFSNIVDFDSYTLKPNNVKNAVHQLLPVDKEFKVGTITLKEVKEGDIVWLNGVLGLENNSGSPEADVFIKIFKGDSTEDSINQEIYNSDYDIDVTNDEVVAPLSHVDVITNNERVLKYTITVTAEDPNMYLIGPVTLTGMQIRKN